MNSKNLIGIVVVLAVVLGGLYYFQGGQNKKMVRIAMQQTTSHEVYDQIIKGIKEGFNEKGYYEGKNIEIDLENAQGDVTNGQAIAQKFAKGNYDVYMPLGTQASQATVNLVKNKPVIFVAITDPIQAKLVNSLENPGANITGTTDSANYKEQISLFKKLVPGIKKIGVLYNPSEANSASGLKNLQNLSSELGFEVVVAPVNSTNDISNAARSIVSKVDAFYTIPDNTVLSGEEALIKVALESKKPHFTFDQSGVEKGGLLSIGANYEKIGMKSAFMAIEVLNGQNTSNLSVRQLTKDDADLFVNQTTADKLGIKIPDDVLKSAKQIYK